MSEQPVGFINQTKALIKAAAVAVFVFSAQAALAVDTGLEATAKEGGLNTSSTDIAVIVGAWIQYALSFVGVIFLVLMIYAGFLWMTAAGNEEQIKKAKSLIASAVIGAVIVFGAYAITYFIISNVTKGTVTG